jgi:hypothetical protein
MEKCPGWMAWRWTTSWTTKQDPEPVVIQLCARRNGIQREKGDEIGVHIWHRHINEVGMFQRYALQSFFLSPVGTVTLRRHSMRCHLNHSARERISLRRHLDTNKTAGRNLKHLIWLENYTNNLQARTFFYLCFSVEGTSSRNKKADSGWHFMD